MKMIKYTYYSLYDVLNYSPYSDQLTTLKDLCNSYSINITKYPFDLENTEISNLYRALYSRYLNHAIIKKEGNEIYEMKDVQIWLSTLLSILERNADYYITVLSIYNNEKTKLMDSIKSTNIATQKYNDTPQNPNSESVYEGDNYLTSFTKNESNNETELNTKIVRIAEIEQNYSRIIDKWVKEFERIFYEVEVD